MAGRRPVVGVLVIDTVEAGGNTAADVLELIGGVGVDVSIAAVNVGVHGVPVSLPMRDMRIQNVTLTMGLVDTVSIRPC
jgi:alcohol dehydrogenase